MDLEGFKKFLGSKGWLAAILDYDGHWLAAIDWRPFWIVAAIFYSHSWSLIVFHRQSNKTCSPYTTSIHQMKWNESGFRPPLCTYRLNWARRTSWGWWDDWDDTVLQTQDSKFEPWRSEAEHATSRSRRLPTILTFTRGWGRNIFVSFKPPRPGTEPRTLAWKAAVLTTTLGPPPSIHHGYCESDLVGSLWLVSLRKSYLNFDLI